MLAPLVPLSCPVAALALCLVEDAPSVSKLEHIYAINQLRTELQKTSMIGLLFFPVVLAGRHEHSTKATTTAE